MSQPVHSPTGNFPDLDGTGGTGPLKIQATGEVFSAPILIKSADPSMGLMCKLIDACDWLKKNVSAPIAAAITAATAPIATRLSAIMGGAAGASVTRVIDTTWVPTGVAAWSVDTVGGYKTASANPSSIMVPILADIVPNGATITGYRLYVAPNTGRASIAGLTLPAANLASISAFGIPTTIATVSDTSANVAAYETPHTITSGAFSHVVDRGQERLALLFNSESGGANALAAGQLLNATITYTTP